MLPLLWPDINYRTHTLATSILVIVSGLEETPTDNGGHREGANVFVDSPQERYQQGRVL